MILIFALAAGLLAYVIWKFAPSLGRRKGSRQLAKRPPRVVLGEHLAPGETAADLLAQAEALALKGEFARDRKRLYHLLRMGDARCNNCTHKTNQNPWGCCERGPAQRNEKYQ